MHLQLSLTWVGHGQQLCELQGVRVSTRAHMIIYSIYSVAETFFSHLRKYTSTQGSIIIIIDVYFQSLTHIHLCWWFSFHIKHVFITWLWVKTHPVEPKVIIGCSWMVIVPSNAVIVGFDPSPLILHIYIIIYISLSLELLYIYHEIGVRSTIH